MDFSWSDEQIALRDRVIHFAQEQLNDNLVDRDRHGQFLHENWLKCARFGIQGLFVPEAYNGGGKDVLTTILAMEALGYGCQDNGLTLGLNGQMWSVQLPILTFGTPQQKQAYLPGLCAGKMFGAHGMTEPNSGSDAYSLQTRAEKKEGGYVLNGTKTLIGLAPVADVAVVFATTNPDLGRWGISAFLVTKGMPGFVCGPIQEKMGLRTAPMGQMTLDNCFVPEENRLGPEGAGVSLFNHAMEWERGFIFASHVGAMARQLDSVVAYAKQRQQFGQPIGQFQSVSNRIADMKVRLEAAKLLLYKIAWLKQQGKPAALEAATAKLFLGESFVQSSLDAIRINGGRGYLTQFGIERELRDSVGGVIYSGTSDIQRVVIARLLGL